MRESLLRSRNERAQVEVDFGKSSTAAPLGVNMLTHGFTQ